MDSRVRGNDRHDPDRHAARSHSHTQGTRREFLMSPLPLTHQAKKPFIQQQPLLRLQPQHIAQGAWWSGGGVLSHEP